MFSPRAFGHAGPSAWAAALPFSWLIPFILLAAAYMPPSREALAHHPDKAMLSLHSQSLLPSLTLTTIVSELTLEQHGFELPRSAYKQTFFFQ